MYFTIASCLFALLPVLQKVQECDARDDHSLNQKLGTKYLNIK